MVRSVSKDVVRLIDDVLSGVDEGEAEEFMKALMGARRIFAAGAGRSGLVARSFSMRLMHLGFEVYVVGETITPAIGEEDLLIAVSGSGRTASTLLAAETVKERGATVISVTSQSDSPLGRISDVVVRIGGRKDRSARDYLSDQLRGRSESLTPMGTLFELSVGVFFDSIVACLMERMKKSELELKKKHTDLE